jgi:hypothetical protein
LGRLATEPARAILLVAYDAPYPEPLKATRAIEDAFGLGLVLAGAIPARASASTPRSRARRPTPMPMRASRRCGAAFRRARAARCCAHRRAHSPVAWCSNTSTTSPRGGGARVSARARRDWLAANLPHQGAMNLLDEIVAWDDAGCTRVASGIASPRTRCAAATSCRSPARSSTARRPRPRTARSSPRRPPGPGCSSAVRSVDFHAARLDDVAADLDIRWSTWAAASPACSIASTCRRRAARGERPAHGRIRQVKRALVTGGSGAIGSAICRALARDGLEVIVHANSRIDEARRIAAEIGSPHAIAFDVCDRDAARAALEPFSSPARYRSW